MCLELPINNEVNCKKETIRFLSNGTNKAKAKISYYKMPRTKGVYEVEIASEDLRDLFKKELWLQQLKRHVRGGFLVSQKKRKKLFKGYIEFCKFFRMTIPSYSQLNQSRYAPTLSFEDMVMNSNYYIENDLVHMKTHETKIHPNKGVYFLFEFSK